jgi:hypothetical protein
MVFPGDWFFNAASKAYDAVIAQIPPLAERPYASAYAAGFLGMYAMTLIAEKTLERILPEEFKQHIPKLQKAGIAAAFLIPVVYAAIDPAGAEELMALHPVYTIGGLGSLHGSAVRAGQSLVQHKKLEERVK